VAHREIAIIKKDRERKSIQSSSMFIQLA